ncbi:autophagy protein 13 [Coemansia sp. Benny D115]|nr:autophagy protein 13 [Coemansia sp. Benny D115]
MAQRPYFWSRNETGSHKNTENSTPQKPSSKSHIAQGNAHASAGAQSAVAAEVDAADKSRPRQPASSFSSTASHASPRVSPHLLVQQTRLPPNSASSANPAHHPASFSSEQSSSPSPSPSINPYSAVPAGGSLRNMLHGTGGSTRPRSQSQSQSQSVARTPQFGSPIGTMPANIRRSDTVAQQLQQRSPPLPAQQTRYRQSVVPTEYVDDDSHPSTSRLQHQQTRPSTRRTRSSSEAPASGAPPTAAHQPQQPQQPGTAAAATTTTAAAALHSGTRDARCEQIMQNFYSKAVQVVAHLRGGRTAAAIGHPMARFGSRRQTDLHAAAPAEPSSASSSIADVIGASSSGLAGSGGRKVNRWFNLDLEDIGEAKEEAKPWRHAVVASAQPPPMFIEVCLDVSRLSPADELQLADIYGRPWSVYLDRTRPTATTSASSPEEASRASCIVLEVWRLDLDTMQRPVPAPDLPRVYKQAIVFFRSLFSFASLLPAASTASELAQRRSGPKPLSVFLAFRSQVTPIQRDGVIELDSGLTGTDKFLESYAFAPVATPMGSFSMSVQYRRECSFTVLSAMQQSSSLHHRLPAQDKGGGYPLQVDDTYFTPTLGSRSGSSFSAPRHGFDTIHSSRPPRSLRHQPQPQQQQQQQQTADASYSVGPHNNAHSHTMPSVNPFRVRPLSISGDSFSLPGYNTSDNAPSINTHHAASYDPSTGTGRLASSRTSLRRISLGARSHVAAIASHSPVSSALGGASSSVGSRPHSLDHQRNSILGGRLSSSGGAASGDSGSILHRSVMLRRFGDSLSPTEQPHQQHRTFEGTAAASTLEAEKDTTASYAEARSPTRPSVISIRTNSSSGAGGVGRSGLGFSPFKSPSLSESPGRGFAGLFSDTDDTSPGSYGNSARFSQQQSHVLSDEVSRRRGYTLDHEHPETHPQQPHGSVAGTGGMQPLMTKLSESPNSLGSATSSHSRRLSSSFGNRRISMSRRRPSILAASNTAGDHTVRGSGGESPSLLRRHTIFEGQHQQQSQHPEQQQQQNDPEIDAFIHMVDSKQPLRVYTRRDGSTIRQGSAMSSQRRPALTGQPTSGGLLGSPPLAYTGSLRNPSSLGQQVSSEPLRMYHGVLSEFTGISQDMQGSVILGPVSAPAATVEGGAAVDMDGLLSVGDISGSPFRRRQAIPNPLRSSGSAGSPKPAENSRPANLASGNGPLSAAAATTSVSAIAGGTVDSIDETPVSKEEHLLPTVSSQTSGRQSLERMYNAFGNMTLESQRQSESNLALSRLHIRNAAPGLDPEHERPLPQPVTIPYAPHSLYRQQTRPQQQTRLPTRRESTGAVDAPFTDALGYERGRSQPVSHVMGLTDSGVPLEPRMTTPQPPLPPVMHPGTRPTPLITRQSRQQQQQQQQQQQHGSSLSTIGLRFSPDNGKSAGSGGPMSLRSDFITGNRQLGALLSIADASGNKGGFRATPHSTPSTPSMQQSPTTGSSNEEEVRRHKVANNTPVGTRTSNNGRRRESIMDDTLRSNFPPLSFIVPRNRVEQMRPDDVETSMDRKSPLVCSPQPTNDDEDDMIFQMDASTY